MAEERIIRPRIPEDFDSFWEEAKNEALAEPLDFSRSLSNDFDWRGFVVETIRFRGIRGSEVEGWIAIPPGSKREKAFLWVPPYGRESLLPNIYGTRPGFVSMSLNLHGHTAFHQETYLPSRGYFAQGAEEPGSWIFRTMVQNCLLALRVLQAQSEADEDRIATMGMSQGAGISIWLGALSPIVRCVAADMPFLGGLRDVLPRQAYRYPLKELTDYADSIPLGMERILNTIDYYDTINFATRCGVPTLVTAGTKDPAVRVEQARSVFEALPGEKQFVLYDWGHDWHPEMVANNKRWLERHLTA